MRHITTLLILIFSTSIFAQNNVVKTAGVSYTAGAPTFSPGRTGSQVAIDTVTGLWYEHNGTSWSASGYRVQTISGCSAPAYTPEKYQSRLVINACSAGQGGPELYYWTGSVWLQINEGQTYTAGTGISIVGSTITNTGDLSNTNEIQTLSIEGSNLSLSNGGGTVALPATGITSLGGQTGATQTFATGTSGTNFAISSSGNTHTFNLPDASATNRGALSSADWSTFNSKDPSSTNELNMAFSVTGGNLRITDSGGSLDVPISGIAPLQSVTAGSGVTITGTAPDITVSAVDVSATNELNTSLTVSGGNVQLSDAGGTLSLPVLDIAPDQSTTNELQTLSFSSPNLSISGGNSVNISGIQDGNGIISALPSAEVKIVSGANNLIFQKNASVDVYQRFDTLTGYVNPNASGYWAGSEGTPSTRRYLSGFAPDAVNGAGFRSFLENANHGDWKSTSGGLTGSVMRSYVHGSLSGSTSGVFLYKSKSSTATTSQKLAAGDDMGYIAFSSPDTVRTWNSFSSLFSIPLPHCGISGYEYAVASYQKPYGGLRFYTTNGSATQVKALDLNTKIEMLLPTNLFSVTTVQRNAIPGLVAGTTIYCSDCTATDSSTGVQQVWNGGTWKNAW